MEEQVQDPRLLLQADDLDLQEEIEDGVIPEERLNPLEIADILEVVFDHVSSPLDLRNVRQVNRLWRDVSLGLIAGLKFTLTSAIGDRKSIKRIITSISEDGDPHRLLEKPFHKYKLEIYSFSRIEYGQFLMPFWSNFGNHIKSLKISYIRTERDGKLSEELRTLLLQYLPNLSELIVEPVNEHNQYYLEDSFLVRGNDALEFKERSSTSAVKLTSLTILGEKRGMFEGSSTVWNELLELVPNLMYLTLGPADAGFIFQDRPRHRPTIPLLKGLKFLSEVSLLSGGIRQLINYIEISQCHVHITTLSVSIENGQAQEHSNLYQIMEHCFDSLISLKLAIYESNELEETPTKYVYTLENVGAFSKIQQFTLQLNLTKERKEAFYPFNFQVLGSMPSLQKCSVRVNDCILRMNFDRRLELCLNGSHYDAKTSTSLDKEGGEGLQDDYYEDNLHFLSEHFQLYPGDTPHRQCTLLKCEAFRYSTPHKSAGPNPIRFTKMEISETKEEYTSKGDKGATLAKFHFQNAYFHDLETINLILNIPCYNGYFPKDAFDDIRGLLNMPKLRYLSIVVFRNNKDGYFKERERRKLLLSLSHPLNSNIAPETLPNDSPADYNYELWDYLNELLLVKEINKQCTSECEREPELDLKWVPKNETEVKLQCEGFLGTVSGTQFLLTSLKTSETFKTSELLATNSIFCYKARPFHYLKRLSVEININDDAKANILINPFDFGTLKNIPSLEKLSIVVHWSAMVQHRWSKYVSYYKRTLQLSLIHCVENEEGKTMPLGCHEASVDPSLNFLTEMLKIDLSPRQRTGLGDASFICKGISYKTAFGQRIEITAVDVSQTTHLRGIVDPEINFQAFRNLPNLQKFSILAQSENKYEYIKRKLELELLKPGCNPAASVLLPPNNNRCLELPSDLELEIFAIPSNEIEREKSFAPGSSIKCVGLSSAAADGQQLKLSFEIDGLDMSRLESLSRYIEGSGVKLKSFKVTHSMGYNKSHMKLYEPFRVYSATMSELVINGFSTKSYCDINYGNLVLFYCVDLREYSFRNLTKLKIFVQRNKTDGQLYSAFDFKLLVKMPNLKTFFGENDMRSSSKSIMLNISSSTSRNTNNGERFCRIYCSREQQRHRHNDEFALNLQLLNDFFSTETYVNFCTRPYLTFDGVWSTTKDAPQLLMRSIELGLLFGSNDLQILENYIQKTNYSFRFIAKSFYLCYDSLLSEWPILQNLVQKSSTQLQSLDLNLSDRDPITLNTAGVRLFPSVYFASAISENLTCLRLEFSVSASSYYSKGERTWIYPLNFCLLKKMPNLQKFLGETSGYNSYTKCSTSIKLTIDISHGDHLDKNGTLCFYVRTTIEEDKILLAFRNFLSVYLENELDLYSKMERGSSLHFQGSRCSSGTKIFSAIEFSRDIPEEFPALADLDDLTRFIEEKSIADLNWQYSSGEERNEKCWCYHYLYSYRLNPYSCFCSVVEPRSFTGAQKKCPRRFEHWLQNNEDGFVDNWDYWDEYEEEWELKNCYNNYFAHYL